MTHSQLARRGLSTLLAASLAGMLISAPAVPNLARAEEGAPEPVAQAAPEPDSQSEPDAQPGPSPEEQTATEPEAQPAAQVDPDPEPQPTPEPEAQADPEPEAQAEPLPAKFDLRDRGVVTPVKRQNPWASCWSFGAIAAAESSILSEMGATYADTGLDLSERHLIFFSMNPITEDQNESQSGEGLYHLGGEGNNNAAFRTANTIVSSTLFSTGVGPMLEEDYPYQNSDGMTEYEYMKAFPDNWKAQVKGEVEESRGKSIAQIIQENAGNPNFAKTEEQYLQNSWNGYLKTVENADNYTEYLDWSLDYGQRDQSASYVLIDGNGPPSSQCARRAFGSGSPRRPSRRRSASSSRGVRWPLACMPTRRAPASGRPRGGT